MYESKILVTLDIICPWCYLATTRLNKALEEAERDGKFSDKVRFTVQYLPYQLYPDFPSEPVDRFEWLRDNKHGGSDEKTRAYEELMSSYGQAYNIQFRSEGLLSNTLHTHRVIQFFQDEQGEETAGKLVKALQAQYFEQKADPSSPDTLISACVAAGIEEASARRVVADKEEGLADVKHKLRQAAIDTTGEVPHIMFIGKRRDLTSVGAQEIEQYAVCLETIAKDCR